MPPHTWQVGGSGWPSCAMATIINPHPKKRFVNSQFGQPVNYVPSNLIIAMFVAFLSVKLHQKREKLMRLIAR
jgi:hypothetical protein